MINKFFKNYNCIRPNVDLQIIKNELYKKIELFEDKS